MNIAKKSDTFQKVVKFFESDDKEISVAKAFNLYHAIIHYDDIGLKFADMWDTPKGIEVDAFPDGMHPIRINFYDTFEADYIVNKINETMNKE